MRSSGEGRAEVEDLFWPHWVDMGFDPRREVSNGSLGSGVGKCAQTRAVIRTEPQTLSVRSGS